MSADTNIVAATELQNILTRTVWRLQDCSKDQPWRSCFACLIPALDPRHKTFRVEESLSCVSSRFDKTDFLNAMAHLGYFARCEILRIDDVDERLMPCLFIPDGEQGAPCVLLGKDRIFAGKGQKIRPFPNSSFRGECWFFEPYNEDKEDTSKNVRAGTGHSWFRALLSRFHGTFWHVLSLGLVLNMIALATPLFIMLVYDRVISSNAPETLPMLAAGAALAIAAEWGLRTVRSRHLSALAARLDNIVSNRIFDHLLHLSPGYIERASVPSQVARIKTFEAVRDFFSGSVFLSLLEMPFMVIALAAIAVIAGPLALVPVAMAGLYAVLFYMIWRKVRVAIRTSAKAASARQGFALETVEKLEAINNNGLSDAWSRKFHDIAARDAITAFRLSWLGMVGETLANALTVLSAVAVIGFGVGLIWAGQMTTGALVATMILVWRILTPFYSLCTMIPRIDQLRNSVRQVDRLMDIDNESTMHRTSARLNRVKGQVSFAGVGLRYDEKSDPLFAGLTFEAMPGDIVAVTGFNGSGKTSILKMVKGMYPASTGSIRIDGFDIRQLDPTDLRRRIAYVPQTPYFFHGAIAENLRFANPLASERELEIALGQAGLLEEIKRLPEGINTVIGGDSKIRLSSSVELRLSLVRAYLHDAPVLLIDELPNSLMTEQAGKFLRDHLLRHRRKRTVIMVTHREDFMDMADTIIELRRGLPPQVGPRQFMLDKLKKEQW